MTTRGTAGRAITVLALVTGGLALATAPANADHSIVERVSTGPAGGNGAEGAFFDAISPDGARVYFHTDESLVPEDTDGGDEDIYERSAGVTRLVTVGLEPGAIFVQFQAASPDGQHVFFETEVPASPEDGDTQIDVYDRTGGQTRLVSTGPTDAGTSGMDYWDSSVDGTKVLFSTQEQLTAEDTDSSFDLYLRAGAQTTLLTPAGSGPESQSHYDALSDDATVLVYDTGESLSPGDTDTANDLYRRVGNQVTLVSPGGNDDLQSPEHIATSPDGSRTLFFSEERLTAGDTDDAADVYLWHDGGLTLVTPGTADLDAQYTDANRSLTSIAFRTDESLVQQDTDAERDLYVWRNGAITLVTTAPGQLDNLDTDLVSDDGNRIVVESFSPLTPGEPDDDSYDLYLWDNGQTKLLTPGTADLDARFSAASTDASRVFFRTAEPLLPSDSDTANDIYEATGAGLSKVSVGNAATSANTGRTNASADGGEIVWSTTEQVLADDTDAATDLYLSRVAAPKNLTPPAVSGMASPGQTLSCSPGTWTDAETFAYRWNRDGAPIAGATAATYAVQAGDVGHALSCTVTATGDGGSTSATSAAVNVPNPTGPLPGACANAVVGTTGNNVLRGTAYGDILFGLRGRDVLAGLEGRDCLVGGPGRDHLLGGPGEDRVDGGKGADRVSGGGGRDRVRGSAGADLLFGNGGRDVIVGGRGDDTIKASDHRVDVVRCGRGHDVAVVDREDKVSGCEVVRYR